MVAERLRSLWERAKRGTSRSVSRVVTDAGPLLQQTGAAALAWYIAKHVVKHHEPFFAPIAAMVGMNATLGERGAHALRLLMGVFVGIGAGELWMFLLGRGYGTLALATLTAMVVARAVGGARIVTAQAGAAAILMVAVTEEHFGTNRLVDAMIGIGVALVFTQVLFSPEPVALLRRAQAAALGEMARVLELSAKSLERDDPSLAERAVLGMRTLRDRLSELSRYRVTSAASARHSLIWQSRRPPLVGENARAGHLDLLGQSCLMLMRMAMVAKPQERPRLEAVLRQLSHLLADLSRAPADRLHRQRAADGALALSRGLASADVPPHSMLAAALTAGRIAAADLMVFAGVEEPPG